MQMSLVQEGVHNWSGFQVKESTSKPAVPREQEAAQTRLGHRQSQGLGEKKASVAFLSKNPLGLWFIPRGELVFLESSS